MSLQRIELVETPVVGCYYLVPTVQGRWYGINAVWPVIGPRHNDKDIIGFKPEHYHLDVRFVPQRVIAATFRADIYLDFFKGPLHEVSSPLVNRRRRLKRQMPEYPMVKMRWHEDLETCFRAHVLGKRMLCPHRGVPLKGQPVRDGIVTCPAHGLQWNVASGRLVERVINS